MRLASTRMSWFSAHARPWRPSCAAEPGAVRVFALPAVVALATILIAAGFDLESNKNRFKALPVEERKKLVDNLLRFDAVLTLDQKRAVEELDRKIHELPDAQQSEYLATLRRYHNWLARLPEDRREEIMRASPTEKMAAVRKLASLPRYHVPQDLTPSIVQLADIGEHTPFELAAIYRIWQALTPAQRKEVDKPVNNSGRLQVLLRIGQAKKMPREIVPEGYDEERVLADLATFLKKGSGVLAVEPLKKQSEPRFAEVTRRQAINLYYLSAARKGSIKHVEPERLDQFAATFPWWVQSAFESYSPDEARRRLTIVYRLVFPPPSEIRLLPREALGAASGSRPAPPAAKKTTAPPGAGPLGKSDLPL